MFPKMLQDALPGFFPAPGAAAGIGAELYRPMLTIMAGYGNLVTASTSALSLEWLNFVSRRMAKDLAHMNRLANCRTPECLLAANNDYWQMAIEDYQAEWSQIMQLSGRTANSFLDMLRRSLPTQSAPDNGGNSGHRNGAMPYFTG